MSDPKVASASLSLQPFTSSEEGAWSNAYLIGSSSEVILFDVPMLRGDAVKLADLVAGSGKQLTTVFISHAHPDHFMGSDLIADRFPMARFVSTGNVVADIEADGPWMLSMLQGKLGPDAPKRLVVPDVLSAPAVQISANLLNVVEFGECEATHIATLHIPDLKLLLAADLVYHDAHLYLQERHIESWRVRLDELAIFARRNDILVLCPGHGAPAGPELIDQTRNYLDAFADAVQSGDPRDVERRMLVEYPEYHVKQFLTAFSIPAYFPSASSA